MRKRYIKRALSLAAALALALTASGLAEAAIEPEEIEVTFTAEAVDEPVECEELELGDGTDLSETDLSETDLPETDLPETDLPETDLPETDQPGADQPALFDDDADEASDPLSDAELVLEDEAVPAEDAGAAEVTDPGDAAAPDAPEAPDAQDETAGDVPPTLSNAEMADNLRACASLGAKAGTLGKIAELLMDRGFEPAFAAGVCANIYSEGGYGLFERSGYESTPEHPDLEYIRPRYFCYLDGGNYYTHGANGYVVTDVYLSPEDMDAYTGSARVHMRYGDENYYLDNWSGRRVWEIDLNALEEFMVQLAGLKLQYGTPDAWEYDKSTDTWEYNEPQESTETWRGKFGLGCAQWTGEESLKLMAYYRKYAGAGNPTITKEQVVAAEHEMILNDLLGYYNKVYTGWKQENANALYSAKAAESAGSWVCLKYEIPANRESKAVRRGRRAAGIYKIMVGENE